MGVVVGLGVGIGLLLIGSAFLTPRATIAAPRRPGALRRILDAAGLQRVGTVSLVALAAGCGLAATLVRSEEHTSELQSRENLVCRLLLEKKKYRHTSP